MTAYEYAGESKSKPNECKINEDTNINIRYRLGGNQFSVVEPPNGERVLY